MNRQFMRLKHSLGTPDSLAEKVHELEHRYYPEVIEKYITDNGYRITDIG